MPRHDGRAPSEHRPVHMVTGFHRNAEGSVLYRAGGTVVLCTASLADEVPRWMAPDEVRGWITAEYQMHPRSNPTRREPREGRGRPPKGRTMEIQRLVGRALRAGIDLQALGRRSITIDCDVLEADGGTRTASVTGGFVALALALAKADLLQKDGPKILRDQVAAISVGLAKDQVLVDLDYPEDSTAEVDMNVVATAGRRLIEVQGTAEDVAVERSRFDAMLDAALDAVDALAEIQRQVLREAGIELGEIMGKPATSG